MSFKISQSSWDVNVLEYIQKSLGIGKVEVNDPIGYTHRFIIRDQEGLSKIIALVNGRLQLTKKQEQFREF